MAQVCVILRYKIESTNNTKENMLLLHPQLLKELGYHFCSVNIYMAFVWRDIVRMM